MKKITAVLQKFEKNYQNVKFIILCHHNSTPISLINRDTCTNEQNITYIDSIHWPIFVTAVLKTLQTSMIQKEVK